MHLKVIADNRIKIPKYRNSKSHIKLCNIEIQKPKIFLAYSKIKVPKFEPILNLNNTLKSTLEYTLYYIVFLAKLLVAVYR